MRIETMWLSENEMVIAISAIVNDNSNNEVCDLVKLDDTSSGYDIINLVNSIDDGYFPDEHSCNEISRRTYADLIEGFMDDDYDEYYAFFIKERFCGFIKRGL